MTLLGFGRGFSSHPTPWERPAAKANKVAIFNSLKAKEKRLRRWFPLMQRMDKLRTILLVDDDPNDVELALQALAEHRLANEIAVVNDGEQALDFLYRWGPFEGSDRTPPAVVLLDLKMPKVDGLTVLRTIKSDQALKTVPVVMLTSSREERDLIASYELGVNAYVVKPVNFSQFIEAIKQLGFFWAVLNECPGKSGTAAQARV